MTKTHKARLRKMIAFLRELPPEKFDLRAIGYGRKCPTVACAIGWTPSIFPDLVKWSLDGGECVADVVPVNDDAGCWRDAVKVLFDVPSELFTVYGQKAIRRELQTCADNATPVEVAAMLEKFLELQEESK